LGLAVFDALLEAQHHRDIEVARRARYLLRGMPVEWSVDTDPQEVRSLLRNYGQQGRDERLSRIEHLANLKDSLGTEALCRIMRYEADVVLSKQAALQLMWHQTSVAPEDREAIARRIREAVGNSRRPAVRWLRTYADTLVSIEPTLDEWERITRDELESMVKTPDETQRSVVRDLLRWHVDLLRGLGRDDEVRTNITRIVELVQPDREELFDVVDWALEREAWFVPGLLAERFPAEYWQYELLVYRLAEAKRKQGDEAGAEETAKQALGMNPNQYNLHLAAARDLRRERQMFDWAESEFRQVIETAGASHKVEVFSRELLAQMFGDLQREREAAETLEPSFQIGEKDPVALAAVYEAIYGRAYTPADVRAKIDHFLGIYHGREGDIEKQKEFLEKALAVDTENIDIVIALHRVADDDKVWREKVDNLLAQHVGRIESRMKELEEVLSTNQDQDVRGLISEEFAQRNNEYAWLVSNTVGDYLKAVACSQKSLELVPDSWPYQDTLGRCFFAAGDYKNAIRYQKLAVAQAPYMQQMRRQLKLFEDKLAETASKEN
jgi:tetratricopeptide (TPR) repeat protein